MLLQLFNDDKRILNKAKKKVDKVNSLKDKYGAMSNVELRSKTEEFKALLKEGKSIDDILCDAYATVREAAKRVKNEFPYDVQLLGAIVMNNGDIAEMKTGEGKTLTAVLPVYLNALEGKGVHVITVNEYLAERDATLNGEIYRFLGLSVGVNKKDLSLDEKRQVYNCDITYTTSSELGFDYLKDNMVRRKEDRVLRGLHFALIDEADSILIDESRTPLIISGAKKDAEDLYTKADIFTKSLKEDIDYEIYIKDKLISLTESGINKAEAYFGVDNLYDKKYVSLVHHINQSLRANYIMQKDIDYMVDDVNDKIVIIDSFTGRLMEGRAYSEGLHQAIEAKEGITINGETKTIATIIYQNFFRLYDKLAGMTGTAKTCEEEILDTYNMRVVEIPTNKPVIRKDLDDLLYGTKKAKFNALLEEVKELHLKGQPILIGTADVETSEMLSKMLKKINIKHEVLNAKNHAKEADIIAKAGQKNAVTIATNMAGRGTDIKLGEGVKELGGLAVLGSERHESRRIDNQLRGRSGRQGDPGFSRFYVSMEDDIMVRYGSDKAKFIAETLEDEAMSSSLTSKTIQMAQNQVEGLNYDVRKSVLDYDEVLRQQREVIYENRDYLVDNDNIEEYLKSMLCRVVNNIVINNKDIVGELNRLGYMNDTLPELDGNELVNRVCDDIYEAYEAKTRVLGDYIHWLEKNIALKVLDEAWIDHIDTMEKLKKGIGLRSYAQNNPLEAYVKEGYELFNEMMDNMAYNTISLLTNIEISYKE